MVFKFLNSNIQLHRALAGLAKGDAGDLYSTNKCVTNEMVDEMVYKALCLQAADGTGLADYAESPGQVYDNICLVSHVMCPYPQRPSF